MLGETTGTSAGGAAEAGKFLRVPGTNPFFPLPHGLQGNRILDLLGTHPIDTYLLNTGRVGGDERDERSKKVKIPHTSACVKGIAEGSISWTEDDDFGYLVAERVPDLDDAELLRPRRLYERHGRMQEYAELVERLKAERIARLEEFPELTPEIVKAAG
jgi:phosphoenolpyruvate carboxykinase (ATP)